MTSLTWSDCRSPGGLDLLDTSNFRPRTKYMLPIAGML